MTPDPTARPTPRQVYDETIADLEEAQTSVTVRHDGPHEPYSYPPAGQCPRCDWLNGGMD